MLPLLLTLVACTPPVEDTADIADTGGDTGDTGDTDDTAETGDTGDTGAALQAELDTRRGAWEADGLADYTYVLGWLCFCDTGTTGPATVVVSGGAVVSSTYVETGAPTTAAFDARTIDGLFDFLQESLDAEADAITVTWDPTYGFPAQAYVDYMLDADDDELGLQATDLTTP